MAKYTLWFGTFDSDNFVWDTIKEFDDYKPAVNYFDSFVKKQFARTYDDLVHEYGNSRLDIELRLQNKRLDWVGIYKEDPDRADNKKEVEPIKKSDEDDESEDEAEPNNK